MGSVSTSPQARSTVYLNVFNIQTIYIKTFNVCIRFGVSQKLQQEFSRLLWPTSLGHAPLFSLQENYNDFSQSIFRVLITLSVLTCAQRPTPPLNLLKGTHSFLSLTFFKYCTARRRGIFLMVLADSLVF